MGWPEWKGEKSPIYLSLQTGDISCNVPPERGNFGCNGSPETRVGGGGAGMLHKSVVALDPEPE